MKLGLLAGAYGSLPFEDVLDRVAALGLTTVELAAGGMPGAPHLDPERLRSDDGHVAEVRAALAARGLELSAVAVHGNPLHPVAETARAHDADLRRAVEVASRLGASAVTCFSGLPGDRGGGTTPNWVTTPWPRAFSELLTWQWEDIAIPYWQTIADHAQHHGVRIAIELHPGMLVYNPETMLRLREAAGPAIGANFDPSHLFWQGIDVLGAVRELGRAGAIHHVHAKDTQVDERNVRRNGNLDAKPYTDVLNRAWTFRTIGFGHDEGFWRGFVSELRLAGYDGALSIEHEDLLADPDEGIAHAISVLRRCLLVERPTATPWWT